MSDGKAVPVFAEKEIERRRKPQVVVSSSSSDTDEENNEMIRKSHACESTEKPDPKHKELADSGAQASLFEQGVAMLDMSVRVTAGEPGPSRSITISMTEADDEADALKSHTYKRKLYTERTLAQPEILMTAEDTDYEEGDEPAYTECRRKAKDERYKQRIQAVGEESQLQDHGRNAPFVETFNKSLAKKESAGKKEEIHKYTRILFTGTNSWLKFVTSQNDGEFFLDDLTAWESPRLRLPGLPKLWFDTVEHEAASGTKL